MFSFIFNTTPAEGEVKSLTEITWCNVCLKLKPAFTELLMLHGADYLARLMLCHFACFNNQSNKIRVYRAILLPCYSLNLPRVSPG